MSRSKIELAPYGLDKTGSVNPPHEVQDLILDWFEAVKRGLLDVPGLPVLYVQGGWRSGKTSSILGAFCEIGMLCPGVRMLFGRKDLKDLLQSTKVSWDQIRPAALVKERNNQDHWERWHNGTMVFYRDLKDLEGLGGQEFGPILVSEPYECEEQIIQRLRGRASQADVPRMLILEGNPVNEGHWLHKLVHGSETQAPDRDVTFIRCPTDANFANLPKDYISWMCNAPDSWQRKYRSGDWGFVPSGQPVYELFRENLHVHMVDLIPDRQAIRSWDSGVRHPACLWGQLTARGQLLIQYEHLGVETGLGAFAQTVLNESMEWYGPRVMRDMGDPAMFARAPQTGISDSQLLQNEHGISFEGRRSTYSERKVIIDKQLSRLVDGEPAIKIHPRCRTLIDGLLGGYHYKIPKTDQAYNKPFEEPFKDGFYEHLCLHGETKVRTVRGWETIKDLTGKRFITYAYDQAGKRLVPCEAVGVGKTAEAEAVWKLILDDGQELVATPDHLIMLRDGTYRRLDALQPKDSLMPFYEHYGAAGHCSLELNDGSIVYEHRYLYSNFIGPLEKKHHIHHVDGNPGNNHPSNLQQLTAREHMAEVYDRVRKHPKWTESRQSKMWTDDMKRRVALATKARHASERKPMLCQVCGSAFEGIKRSKYCSKRCNEKTRRPEYSHLRTPRNHKVVSVEPWGISDVYDVAVEKHHNFPANGIMVHNCNAFEYMVINVFGEGESFSDQSEYVERRLAVMEDIPTNGGFHF